MQAPHELKIGAFARLAGISVVALRHYEQVSVLTPSRIDPETGYRYYQLDQLPRLNRLLALQDLGFSLDEIRYLLQNNLSFDYLHGMFAMKQAQIQHLIDDEQDRLQRIATRLQQIEQEGKMPRYDIGIKQVDELLVASIRELIALEFGLGQSYGKLAAYLEQQHEPVRPPIIFLFHSRAQICPEGTFHDVEVALGLESPLPGNEEITIHTLTGGLMACTVHTGMDLQLGQAYRALQQWVEKNHYQIRGPARQLRLKYGTQLEPTEYVTEVQYPIGETDSMKVSER